MYFNIKGNYNFEILSFFNILTSDDYYVKLNKKAYEKFFPLIMHTYFKNHDYGQTTQYTSLATSFVV